MDDSSLLERRSIDKAPAASSSLRAGVLAITLAGLAWSGGLVHDPVELTAGLQSDTLVNGLTSFGQDADGELYVCSAGSGSVFRIDPGSN